MSTSRKRTGDAGENIAAVFLIDRGYKIIDTNFRCQYGEVDIIAECDNCLMFVEVRTKKSLNFGTPEESITKAKKERLILTAQTYLQENKDLTLNWRIDVVAVELHPDNSVKRIDHIENVTS